MLHIDPTNITAITQYPQMQMMSASPQLSTQLSPLDQQYISQEDMGVYIIK